MKKRIYSQLSSEERDQIAYLRAQGKSVTDIAESIRRNKSTVSRELKRNRSPIYNVYLANKAHERAVKRKHESVQRQRIRNPLIGGYIMKKLKLKWSPETIAGRLPDDHPGLHISHEAIYQFIYSMIDQPVQSMTLFPFWPGLTSDVDSEPIRTATRRFTSPTVSRSRSVPRRSRAESNPVIGKPIPSSLAEVGRL
jgi:IS30 family transposase